MCLFLMVPWVGMHSVNVAFSGHTHLLFMSESELFFPNAFLYEFDILGYSLKV